MNLAIFFINPRISILRCLGGACEARGASMARLEGSPGEFQVDTACCPLILSPVADMEVCVIENVSWPCKAPLRSVDVPDAWSEEEEDADAFTAWSTIMALASFLGVSGHAGNCSSEASLPSSFHLYGQVRLWPKMTAAFGSPTTGRCLFRCRILGWDKLE
jgi:hypothetical protein